MPLLHRILALATILILLGFAPVHAHDDAPILLGHMLISNYDDGENGGALVMLTPEATNSIQTLVETQAELFSEYSFFMGSEFVLPSRRSNASGSQYVQYDFFDTHSWQIARTQEFNNSGYYLPQSAVYLPKDDNIFMVSYVGELDYSYWVTLATSNFSIRRIKECPEEDLCFALCVATDGTVYGFSIDGYLCSIDPITCAITRIFAVEKAGTARQGAYYDPTRHAIYRSVPTNMGCAIYRCDLITQQESLIQTYNKPEAIHALAYDSLHNETRIPAAVTDLAVNIDPVQVHTGIIHFTAPTTDMQSQPLSRSLRAIIAIDGVTTDTIDITAGATHDIPHAFAPGEHLLTLHTLNEYGRGCIAFTRFFAGYDYPLAVDHLAASTALPVVNLSWETPAAMHNGTIDTASLRYRITRYPDNLCIADVDAYTLSVTDTLPDMPGSYHYGIVAYTPSYESPQTISRSFFYYTLINTPYTVNRWEEAWATAFTVEDVNDDGYSWHVFTPAVGHKSMCYRYHTINKADDAFFTPAMELRSDSLYRAHIYARAGAAEYSEEFSAYITYDDTYVRATEHGITRSTVTETAGEHFSFDFNVPHDNTYNLCIHCSSEPNRYMLHIDSLQVVAIGVAAAPDSVAITQVTTGNPGHNCVAIACTAPTRTAAGNPLAAIDSITVYRNDSLIASIAQPLPGSLHTVTDSVPAIGRYLYTLVAHNEAGTGITSHCNLVAGSCELPFSHNFAQGAGFFTIVDNNHDNTTWHHYNDRFMGCMRYLSHEQNDADDWLISPPVLLDAHRDYEVTYSLCAGLSLYPESMRIVMGRSPQPADMSYVLHALTDFTFINDSTITWKFSVPLTSYYYIGLQACSPADRYAILLRDFAIDYSTTADVTAIDAQAPIKAWGSRGTVVAYSNSTAPATVYDLTGRLVKTVTLHPGQNQWSLPAGIYLIRSLGVIVKVAVM